MPIFEYECKKCNNIFEKLVLTETPKIICPICSSETVTKIISSSNFKVKGYSELNGYTKKNWSGEEIVKNGPEKSIENMKHNMR